MLIDCPRTWDLGGVMPVGVPAERPARARPALATLVFQDAFGRRWAPAQTGTLRRLPAGGSVL